MATESFLIVEGLTKLPQMHSLPRLLPLDIVRSPLGANFRIFSTSDSAAQAPAERLKL